MRALLIDVSEFMFKVGSLFGVNPKVIVISIVVLGMIFRLGSIDVKPYWEDEVYTSMRVAGYELAVVQEALLGKPLQVQTLSQYQDVSSGQSWLDTSIALAKRTEHTPLYFLLARAWAEILGSSVWGMRLLPALVSILTLPLFYWMALLLFKSPTVAR
ncbi:MAG: hypothetical protein F6K42_10855, partial [Leptolyngbya sp. SIO1D8]|nr:hypothetical protein [Leptolyngbya sp. SIO1D8]